MTDKEVGIIWGARGALPSVVTDLIRKLVEERKMRYSSMTDVLNSFGIDPETWE